MAPASSLLRLWRSSRPASNDDRSRRPPRTSKLASKNGEWRNIVDTFGRRISGKKTRVSKVHGVAREDSLRKSISTQDLTEEVDSEPEPLAEPLIVDCKPAEPDFFGPADQPSHEQSTIASKPAKLIPSESTEPLTILDLGRPAILKSKSKVRFADDISSEAEIDSQPPTESTVLSSEPVESIPKEPEQHSSYLRMSYPFETESLTVTSSDGESKTLMELLNMSAEPANPHPTLLVEFAIPFKILKPLLGPNARELSGESFGMAATLSSYSDKADVVSHEIKRSDTLQKEYEKRRHGSKRLAQEDDHHEKPSTQANPFLDSDGHEGKNLSSNSEKNKTLESLTQELQEAESALEMESLRLALAIQRKIETKHENESLERTNKILLEENTLLQQQIDNDTEKIEETTNMIQSFVTTREDTLRREADDRADLSTALEEMKKLVERERAVRLAVEAEATALKETIAAQRLKVEGLKAELASVYLPTVGI